MQAKNHADRRKAFWNFLLVFTICIVIILTTVFFSIQVPIKQNKQLVAQIDNVERDREFAKNFTTQMVGITNMLDSLDKVTDAEILDVRITSNIQKLNTYVESDSVYEKPMYMLIISNLYQLQKNKRDYRTVAGKDANVEDLSKRLNECDEKYRRLDREFTDYVNRPK